MNKNIMLMYIWVLKEGGRIEAEMTEDGVCEIWLKKDRAATWYTDGYTEQRFFRLYPRNPYTGEFDDSV